MTKLKTTLAVILMFCSFYPFIYYKNSVYADRNSAAEIAMELTTGKVLHEECADMCLPMASTTKIMTAILIIEDCELEKEVIVPDKCIGVEGSSIYLKRGERINVIDLLYGLMMRSGNDAATALAIIHSGSIDKFVENMNKKAVEIGAENTNFCNPSGLPNENHFTTARDLCNIARYAMQNQVFKKIVSSKNYNGKYRSYSNKNKMLFSCEGANGVKTGYTLKAGRCLVSSAEREGMDVVCVVLNCPQMYEISSEILNNCFNKFALKTLSNNRVFLCKNKPCCVKESKVFVVNKDIELRYEVLCHAQFGCNKDNLVGDLNVYEENRLLFSENLYSI